ncbi:MAG TPA: phosphatase PAP2 family protein [Bacillales bacterium]
MMSIIRKRGFLLAGFVVLSILFIILALNYQSAAWLDLGHSIQSGLYDMWGEFGDLFFIVITYIGSGYVAYPLTALLVIYLYTRRNRWTAALFAFNLIGVRQLNWLLKAIVERQRPGLEHLLQVSYYSFPSGHAMNSTAFFGFLAYVLHRKLKMKGLKTTAPVWIATDVLVFLIGISRVYLGVHYPMDVLGGFLAGGAWLCLTLFLDTFITGENKHLTSKTEPLSK